MILTFLTGLVGPKFAKPALYALIVVTLLSTLAVGKCVLDNRAAKQAEQTTRSSDAIATAAEQAVATITNSSNREASVDEVVAQAAKEIDNAPTSSAARAAALNAVCVLPEYRLDPACAVRKPAP